MKKIMFNDKYGLTEAVLNGNKTQTRRVEGPSGTETRYSLGEVIAIAQNYEEIYKQEGLETINEIAGQSLKDKPGWKNKMFVKPELMSHFIKIIGIRREQLHDISNSDCLAEGIFELRGKFCVPGLYERKSGVLKLFESPKDAYASLIDKIGHTGDWYKNPEVVVYEFELVAK